VVVRSMASICVSPFGRRGKMAIRPFTPFPPPPLKFRTAGFPQDGFKRAVSSDLQDSRPLYAATVEISPMRGHAVVGLSSKRHAPSLTRLTRPVALGSAAVLMSAGLIAYYGHIRESDRHHWFLVYATGSCADQKFPNLLCQGLIPCPRPYSGGSSSPIDAPGAWLPAFTLSERVRPPHCHTPAYVWSP
jgi:hypothetical protein